MSNATYRVLIADDLSKRAVEILSAHPEIAVEVREICERYGLPYNTGRLGRQLGSVARKILRLALPPTRQGSYGARPEVVVEPTAA